MAVQGGATQRNAAAAAAAARAATVTTRPLLLLLLLLLLAGAGAALRDLPINVQHRIELSAEGSEPAAETYEAEQVVRRDLGVVGSKSVLQEEGLAAGKVKLERLPEATQAILQQQVAEAEPCLRLAFNYTVPLVVSNTFFPKVNSRRPRFRFHCNEGVFLSSYNVDGMNLPEWVLFKVERPVWGASYDPATSLQVCQREEPLDFTPVSGRNGVSTPDAAYLNLANSQMLLDGVDPRETLRKGQLCGAADFLTCDKKRATFAMTNVVPFNRYLYERNWAYAQDSIRKYVAYYVKEPPASVKDRAAYLASQSELYRPVHVVSGVHFNRVDARRFDWTRRGEDESRQLRRGVMPDAVWQAVLDPERLKTEPRLAVIAWYCNNRPQVLWPDDNVSSSYLHGPKLCRVLSLDELEDTAGVRPFPTLPKEITNARPEPATWFLTATF